MPNYDNEYLGVENSQHPANQKEIESPQVTIDEDWYWELKEDRMKLLLLKSVLKYYFKIKSNPLDRTSDEEQDLINIETLIKKTLKL